MRSLCSCSRLVSWSWGCSLQTAHSSVHFIMGCQAMTVIFKRRRVLARSGQSAPPRRSAVGALANYEPLSDDSLSSVVTSGARRLLGCRKPFFVFAPPPSSFIQNINGRHAAIWFYATHWWTACFKMWPINCLIVKHCRETLEEEIKDGCDRKWHHLRTFFDSQVVFQNLVLKPEHTKL